MVPGLENVVFLRAKSQILSLWLEKADFGSEKSQKSAQSARKSPVFDEKVHKNEENPRKLWFFKNRSGRPKLFKKASSQNGKSDKSIRTRRQRASFCAVWQKTVLKSKQLY